MKQSDELEQRKKNLASKIPILNRIKNDLNYRHWIIIVLQILLIVLLAYVLNDVNSNIELLRSNPCQLCIDEGFSCFKLT